MMGCKELLVERKHRVESPRDTRCMKKKEKAAGQFIIPEVNGISEVQGRKKEHSLFAFLMFVSANIKGKEHPKRKGQNTGRATELKVENIQIKARGVNLSWYCYFLSALLCSQNSVKAFKMPCIE